MDFSNYTGLKAAIGDFLNRDDLNSGGQIAGFIQLAEATIRRRLRRSVGVVTNFAFTAGASTKALAADMGELRSMNLSPSAALPKGGPPMDQVTFEELMNLRSVLPQSGAPRVFAVRDSTVYVAPAPADQYLTFTLSYYKAFTALSGSVATNPLLDEAPDAYLYGACLEAAPFLEHDERIPVWQSRFDAAIDELNEKRQREEFGASLQKAKLPVVY